MKEYRSDEIDISDAVAVKAEVMHDYSKEDFLFTLENFFPETPNFMVVSKDSKK